MKKRDAIVMARAVRRRIGRAAIVTAPASRGWRYGVVVRTDANGGERVYWNYAELRQRVKSARQGQEETQMTHHIHRAVWVIDETIDLTSICANASWDRQTAIETLLNPPYKLSANDATAFVEFAFADAHGNRACGYYPDACLPGEWLTEAQMARLSIR
jgi:hypothetical protein